jgi:hypothetical protein
MLRLRDKRALPGTTPIKAVNLPLSPQSQGCCGLIGAATGSAHLSPINPCAKAFGRRNPVFFCDHTLLCIQLKFGSDTRVRMRCGLSTFAGAAPILPIPS